MDIENWLADELQQRGWDRGNFAVEVHRLEAAFEANVRARLLASPELCFEAKIWRSNSRGFLLSAVMVPGTHGVRTVPEQSLQESVRESFRRWLEALARSARL